MASCLSTISRLLATSSKLKPSRYDWNKSLNTNQLNGLYLKLWNTWCCKPGISLRNYSNSSTSTQYPFILNRTNLSAPNTINFGNVNTTYSIKNALKDEETETEEAEYKETKPAGVKPSPSPSPVINDKDTLYSNSYQKKSVSQRLNALPRISVVGVGGGGCNAINSLISKNIQDVHFVACNTDVQSLGDSLCESKILLGPGTGKGLGTGSNPDKGRLCALESVHEVVEQVKDSEMVFIVAGLGGGTGTGASPIIAKACKTEDILTVALVTTPFDFEGRKTQLIAQNGLQNLESLVDTVVVVPNQRLVGNQSNKQVKDAFSVVDSILANGIIDITGLVKHSGFIKIDFSDIKTVMQKTAGRAIIGSAEAAGQDRAQKAAKLAIAHPIFADVSIKQARRVLVTITASTDATMQEIDQVLSTVQKAVHPEAQIIFGLAVEPDLETALRVRVIATDTEVPVFDIPSSGSKTNGFFRHWL